MQWQAMALIGFVWVLSPLFGGGGGVESIGAQSGRSWGGSVAGAHNKLLQRTVIRRRVRACGAHDTASRGR